MIDYVKYSLDGKTYQLIKREDGSWSTSANAPLVSGNYSLIFEISENGIISIFDSGNSLYDFYLNVIEQIEKIYNLQDYLPNIEKGILEFNLICDTENEEFDQLYSSLKTFKGDRYVRTSSAEAITLLETFLRIKGQGTLKQRKDYLLALFRKGNKLNEVSIRSITNTIAGSDCRVLFYGPNDVGNPELGQALLSVGVLSPEDNKDYRYEDIYRAISPMVPAHIKLLVLKFYATWDDILDNFPDWSQVKGQTSWAAIKSYVPPR